MSRLESREFRRSLAIAIRAKAGDAWPVEATLHERARTMPAVITGSFCVDDQAMRGIVDPQVHGAALGAALFHGAVHDAFTRAVRGKGPLHVLLSIDAAELRPLLWERLCGPQRGGFAFLGLDQRVAYSRHIPSESPRDALGRCAARSARRRSTGCARR